MAVKNPVLYNIELATPGRSTGVFRRVSSATPLSNVASQRSAAIADYNTAATSALEGAEARKTQYDALVEQLKSGITPLEDKLKGYTSQFETLQQQIKESSAAANEARNTFYSLPARHRNSTVGGYYRNLYGDALATTKSLTSQYNSLIPQYTSTRTAYDSALAAAKQQQEAAYNEYAGEYNAAFISLWANGRTRK